MPWEAVVLIPFIDEDAMITQLEKIDHVAELTPRERARNEAAAGVWTSADAPKMADAAAGR